MKAVTKAGQYTLWSVRTLFMVATGGLFIGADFSSPAESIGHWIGKGLVALTGLLILYVEAWAWWHRLASHRGKPAE